jgi:hypothetical protein
MADKTANQQKHGTGTSDYEQEKGSQQQRDQGKTGQHGGTGQHSGTSPQNPQHEQGKRDQGRGVPHNK